MAKQLHPWAVAALMVSVAAATQDAIPTTSILSELESRLTHTQPDSATHLLVNCTYYGSIAEDHFHAAAAAPFGVCVTASNTSYYLPDMAQVAKLVPGCEYNLELSHAAPLITGISTIWQDNGGYVVIANKTLQCSAPSAGASRRLQTGHRLQTGRKKVKTVLLDFRSTSECTDNECASVHFKTGSRAIENQLVFEFNQKVKPAIELSSRDEDTQRSKQYELEEQSVAHVQTVHVPWYPTGCDYWSAHGLRAASVHALGELGWSGNNIDHVEFFVPPVFQCPWEGAAWMKQHNCYDTSLGCQGWTWHTKPNEPGIRVHEIGHNLGLHHATKLSGDNILAYGDNTSPMGAGSCEECGQAGFNLPNLVSLGWTGLEDLHEFSLRGGDLNEFSQRGEYGITYSLRPLHQGDQSSSSADAKRGVYIRGYRCTSTGASCTETKDTVFIAVRVASSTDGATNPDAKLDHSGDEKVTVHLGSSEVGSGEFTMELMDLSYSNRERGSFKLPTNPGDLHGTNIHWCENGPATPHVDGSLSTSATCEVAVKYCGTSGNDYEVAIAVARNGVAAMGKAESLCTTISAATTPSPAPSSPPAPPLSPPPSSPTDNSEDDRTGPPAALQLDGFGGPMGHLVNGVYDFQASQSPYPSEHAADRWNVYSKSDPTDARRTWFLVTPELYNWEQQTWNHAMFLSPGCEDTFSRRTSTFEYYGFMDSSQQWVTSSNLLDASRAVPPSLVDALAEAGSGDGYLSTPGGAGQPFVLPPPLADDALPAFRPPTTLTTSNATVTQYGQLVQRCYSCC